MKRVVITGLGVVSPIGHGRENYWQALREGRNGIGPIELFDATDFSVRISGEIRDFSPEQWMERKEARRSDRVIHFAVAAADLAVADAGLDVKSLDPDKFGVYLGSGEGGITTSFENMSILIQKGPSRVSP
ncbi:MAG: beta-ketoacyl synthase N-terminal-like domain-containing protein, partial [Synergistales bacterium]|nr:beta-ketoacyl synthase N-terminal-like domain-containing protein [Synergistales bacterium]